MGKDYLTDWMIVKKNELYHYGVKGMKWGKRKSLKELKKDLSGKEYKKKAEEAKEQMDYYESEGSYWTSKMSEAIRNEDDKKFDQYLKYRSECWDLADKYRKEYNENYQKYKNSPGGRIDSAKSTAASKAKDVKWAIEDAGEFVKDKASDAYKEIDYQIWNVQDELKKKLKKKK